MAQPYPQLMRRLTPHVLDGNWNPKKTAWQKDGRCSIMAKIAHALDVARGNPLDAARGLAAFAFSLDATPAHAYALFSAEDVFLGLPDAERDVECLDTLWTALSARPGLPKDLRGAHLDFAPFAGCDLSGLDLRGASFLAADLRGASLAASLLDDASFELAELERCDFSGARTAGCDFTDTFPPRSLAAA